MDILDKIAQSHAFMLESHKAFLELIEDLKDERNFDLEESNYVPFKEPDIEEALEETGLLLSEESSEEDSEDVYYCNEPFPMNRKGFDFRNMDMDDPSFWGGKEIGIPMGLLVHSEDGQGKLLPIRNGLFVDDDGEI